MKKFVAALLLLLLITAMLSSALALSCPKCGRTMTIHCSRNFCQAGSYSTCTGVSGCQKRNVYYFNKHICSVDGSNKLSGNHLEKIEHRYCSDVGRCKY